MEIMAFAAPILPGKLEAWRRFNQETLGTWGREHDEFNRAAGVTREMAWLQQTPEGDLAIVYMEVEHPDRLFQELATSGAPYPAWFRRQVLDIHGLDLTQTGDGALSELDYNWSA